MVPGWAAVGPGERWRLSGKKTVQWKEHCLFDLALTFKPLCLELRVSREAAMEMNTEPSQNEQIVWDDPTARQERAKLADNRQWPGSPSQRCEEAAARSPPTAGDGTHFRDSMTDSELVEMGRSPNAASNCLCFSQR